MDFLVGYVHFHKWKGKNLTTAHLSLHSFTKCEDSCRFRMHDDGID